VRSLAAGLLGLVGGVLCLALLTGCGVGDDDVVEPGSDLPERIAVSSPAFGEGAAIPTRFSCRGAEVSPPLRWTGVPAGVAQLALVVDDPDAPSGTYVHWVLFGLPPDATGLEEGQVPRGAMQGRNSAGDAAYAGPCPPSGTHHYRFTVYALKTTMDLPNGAELDAALAAIDDRAVAKGRLVGTFSA
jgi:Raf kinase inhibitor-like YbhB/YbcL family protein